MLALLTLVVIIFFSLLVTRIATILLYHTGLSQDVAKFQARSALSRVGFATKESELVMKHPFRRKIIMALMLIGNAGIVSVIASLLLTFVGEDPIMPWYFKALILAGAVAFIWVFINSKWVNRKLYRLVTKGLKRFTHLKITDYGGLLHLMGDYEISSFCVEEGHWAEHMSLKQLRLRNEGISVLGIVRSDGSYLGVPNGDAVVETDDQLVLYGRKQSLQNFRQRKKGWHGEKQREKSVEKHRKVKEVEIQQDVERKQKQDDRQAREDLHS